VGGGGIERGTRGEIAAEDGDAREPAQGAGDVVGGGLAFPENQSGSDAIS
jgi:hypothetical protein